MTTYKLIVRTAMIMTVAAFLGAHSICHAVLIVTANPNPPQSAPYIATHKVLGDMMEGMTVTARFSDGTSETAPWLATGTPKEGQAMGASGEWHLTQKGNTYNHLWTLEYHQNGGQRLLTGVTLDGMASGILTRKWSSIVPRMLPVLRSASARQYQRWERILLRLRTPFPILTSLPLIMAR